jgi:hypothetical protein
MKQRILVLLALAIAAASFADTTDLVPDSSIVVVRVARMASDPGVSWLNSTWLNADRETLLRDVLGISEYTEASVTVLPSPPSVGQRVAMVVEMTSAPSESRVAELLSGGTPTRTSVVDGVTVTSLPSAPLDAEFLAFAIVGNAMILGSDVEAVTEVLRGTALPQSAAFRQMAGRVDTASDGLLFASNEDLKFADFLAPLERKWQMSLLLSAMDLEWMASGFDVVDSNRITGAIVFKGESERAVFDIADDAEFLGETFRRKFVAEQIDYTSSVTVDGTIVTLEFTVQGLEPLWLRLFEKGVLSVIRP